MKAGCLESWSESTTVSIRTYKHRNLSTLHNSHPIFSFKVIQYYSQLSLHCYPHIIIDNEHPSLGKRKRSGIEEQQNNDIKSTERKYAHLQTATRESLKRQRMYRPLSLLPIFLDTERFAQRCAEKINILLIVKKI